MNDIFGDIGSARGFSQHAVQREIRCTGRRNGRVRIDQILVRLTRGRMGGGGGQGSRCFNLRHSRNLLEALEGN